MLNLLEGTAVAMTKPAAAARRAAGARRGHNSSVRVQESLPFGWRWLPRASP
jgi:hypothetical protein